MARKTDVRHAGKTALCSHIIESTSFKDNEGNTYDIQGSINCKTVGVIYCILCTECENNIYVGQTGDKFLSTNAIEFFKNKNPENGRSYCKTFLSEKPLRLKFQSHRN